MALIQHLCDSADVADHVWDWLPGHVRDLIEGSLPDGARDGRRLLRWLAGVHDIGKCSPQFALQMPDLAALMRDEGFVFPRHPEARYRHEAVGHLALRDWLVEQGFSHLTATSYAVVVGGHHGRPPSHRLIDELEDLPDAQGRGLWRTTQRELIEHLTDYVGARDSIGQWATTALPPTVQVLLTGAVIVSDWIASNPDLFPYDDLATDDEQSTDRGATGWTSLGLPPPWSPSETASTPEQHAAARFPHLAGLPLRTPQRLAWEAAHAADDVPLMIVEAAMGQGKTEAGLLAAEILAKRFGCGGLFVALPTMATSDAMFDRVLDWIEQLDGAQQLSTFLAHGKSGLNDRYRGLMRHPRAVDVCEEEAATEALVLSWLSGRKKGTLATMSVGTIDQLLFLALQAKHVALRHLGFAGKVVIVDEVHAADDYMRVYLERALEWLGAYRVPVVLMSATLPRAQRQSLSNAYRRGLGAPPSALADDEPYPALTTVTTSGISLTTGPAESDPRRLRVSCVDGDPEALADLLADLLHDGGCAAVVHNTVTRAQRTARLLRERFAHDEVELFHSRFVATHRVRKESELRRRLGRDGDRPHRLIVVGTQVLEQSLDVDFDVMISDLAPVDLLLQRAGRLHRHHRGAGEEDRPERLRSPLLLITGIEEWRDDGLVPAPGSIQVYRLAKLLRAAAVLGLAPDHTSTVSLPDDIRSLVEVAYDPTHVPGPPSWHSAITAADLDEQQHVESQRAKAQSYLLPSPRPGTDLMNWLEAGAHTEADDPRGGVSRVRDSDESIEVLVVRRRPDGEIVCFDDDRRAVYLQGEPPPADVARSIAGTSLRLPSWLTQSASDFDAILADLERDAHAGWAQSPWLRGQLALHLDDDLSCPIGRFRLVYDVDDGLTVEVSDERRPQRLR